MAVWHSSRQPFFVSYPHRMIFYFSATGNTEWAANTIARGTGDRIVSIAGTKERSFDLAPGEPIGFCIPVHAWRPPNIVLQFVRELQITNADQHYTYILCTAGDTTGETHSILQRELETIGLHCDDWFALLMPESYVGLPFMDVDNPENEKRKIRQAQQDLLEFITVIKQRKSHTEKTATTRITHTGHWPKTNSRFLGPLFHKYLVNDCRFKVSNERCIQCGHCASVCPVDDIAGGKGQLPQWKHNGKCMTCFSCYHHCPTHAIEFGRQTRNKGQYFMGHKQQDPPTTHHTKPQQTTQI